MNPTRRRLLKGMGAGVAISQLSRPAGAAATDRVFVHPETGVVGSVLGAIDAVGGTPLVEYENFEFVAAEIPAAKRDELGSDLRVAFIESDGPVGVPSDWTPSVPDVLDPGDDIDCSAHPEQRPSWGWERIGAGDVDLDGSGVDVGILDTGIDTDHCSLTVAGGRNVTNTGFPDDYEDGHGHGTHVAGIAGALDNDIGVVGVAPGVNLYAVKVLDDNGSGRYSTLVAGIDWCMSNDVEVISMSLGGEQRSSTVERAIEDAHSSGHLLLSAAGNNGNDGDGSCDAETMTYPATHERVIAVSAMDEDETAPYSSVGSAVDLLAPGTNIDSTYVDNEYARASGTSAACPFVTGVAALVWQRQRDGAEQPNERVRERLTETAETVLGTCEEGHGLVTASAAVGNDRDGGDEGDADREPTETTPGGGQSGDIRGEGRPISMLDRLADAIEAILRGLRDLFK